MDRHSHRASHYAHHHQQQQQQHQQQQHLQHHHHDADSEDGQLPGSPYGSGSNAEHRSSKHRSRSNGRRSHRHPEANSLDDDGEDTGDSLDIKPPQAGSASSSYHRRQPPNHQHRDRDARRHAKRSSDDRSHSREYGSSSNARPPTDDMVVYHSRSDDRSGRHGSRATPGDRHATVDYYGRRSERSPDQSDAERALQDLRSRLLSKRSKYDAEKRAAAESHADVPPLLPYADAYRYESGHDDEQQHYGSGKRGADRRRRQRDYGDGDKLSSRQTSELAASPGRYEPAVDRYDAYDANDGRREAHDKHRHSDDDELMVVDDEQRQRRRNEHDERRREKHRRHEQQRTADADRAIDVEDDMIEDPDEADERRISPEHSGEESVVHVSDSESTRSVSERSADSSAESDGERSEGELPVTPPSVGQLAKETASSCSRSPESARSRTPESRSRSGTPSLDEARLRSASRSPVGKRSASPRRPNDDPMAFDTKRIPAKMAPVPLRSPLLPAPVVEEQAPVVVVRAPPALPNYYPGVQGCRSVEEFQCLNRIEEGTYGVVYRARDKRTEEVVALKRLKMEKEKEGFPITSLREINTLLKGQHPNIVTVREIVVGSNMDKIFIVMDYVEHDLKSLMETMRHRKQSFLPGEVKCLTQQLLRAVGHLHDNWILHRDLKTSNLLLSHKGILKVGDFGLAREYGSPLKPYTSVVVTLWYRAPELLLCCKEYSHPIDMWSVGCIFAEFLAMAALFPGKSEVDQLARIFKDLGTPNEKIWPGYSELPAVQKITFAEYPVSHLRKKFVQHTSEQGLQLLQGLLTYDPKQRLSADQALRTPYFRELPLPIDPAMFPTWPAKSELGARKALASSPKPPSGGGQFKQLQANDGAFAEHGDGVQHVGGFVLNGGTVAMDGRIMQRGGGFNLKF